MSHRRSAPARSRRAGHSVLELVIAMAVLSATLIIAAEMLLARERQLARAVRVANRMSGEQAMEQLHRDLRAATGIVGPAVSGVDQPLALVHPNGVVLTWLRDGAALVRVRTEAGVALGSRKMLDRVTGFRWSAPSPSGPTLPLVSVEVRYETGSVVIGTGRIGAPEVETAVRRTRVALRGAPAEAW